MRLLFALLVVQTRYWQSWGSLQCLDEDGKPVDWVIMYKIPIVKKDKAPGNKKSAGENYAYITSETASKGWQLSLKPISDKDSIPGRILSPLYDRANATSILYAFYNDQTPDEAPSSSVGHSKGVVAYDESTGFWMVHSVPNYPPKPSNGKYDYPESGKKFGQTFLCMSLKTTTTADAVGVHIQYYRPFIYTHNVPKWAMTNKMFPNILKLASGKKLKDDKGFRVTKLKTIGGVEFIGFAKLPNFGEDLYAKLVAPNIQSSLRVESWQNGAGGGKIDSDCKGNLTIMNIESIDFDKALQTNGNKFSSSKDHSKWAISTSLDPQTPQSNHVCIGDINRMNSQKKRAGGTVCIKNASVWKSFDSIIKSLQPCAAKKTAVKAPKFGSAKGKSIGAY